MSPEPPLDATGIARRHFSTVRRGYEPAEVRAFLHDLADMIGRLQRAEARERERAERAETRAVLAEQLDQHRLVELLGEETARVLDSARAAAHDIRARAQETAARIVRDAREDARGVIEQAEGDAATRRIEILAEADALRREAESEVERSRDDGRALVEEMRRDAEEARDRMVVEGEGARAEAEREAEAIRAAAREEGNALVAEAHAVREHVLGDLARRRRSSREQLERLSAARDRLIAAYEVVRRTVDEAMSELDVVLPEAKAAGDLAMRRVHEQPDPTAEELEAELAVARMAGLVGGGSPAEGEALGEVVGSPEGREHGVPALGEAPGRVEEAGVREGAEVGAGDTGDTGGRRSLWPFRRAASGDGGRGRVTPGAEEPETPAAERETAAGERGPAAEAVGDAAGVSADLAGGVDQPGPEGPATVPSDGEPGAGEPGEPAVDVHAGAVGDADPAAEEEGGVPGEQARVAVDTPGGPGDGAPDAAAALAGDGPDAETRPPAGEAPDGEGGHGGDGPGDVEHADDEHADVEHGEEAGGRVDRLFARIKAERRASTVDIDEGPGGDAGPEPLASGTGVGPAGHTTSDDGAAARLLARDVALADPERELSRRLKRVLADEQNEVFDILRRRDRRREQKPSSAADVLPPPADHAGRYASAGLDELGAAAHLGAESVGGRARAPSSRLATEMGKAVIRPIRERIDHSFEECGDDLDEVTERLRSLYREWKSQRISAVARHYTAAAFARGAYEAVPPGADVVWLVDRTAEPCPDADDNALAGRVRKGQRFPTGHRCPPAHPDCRCLVVPPG